MPHPDHPSRHGRAGGRRAALAAAVVTLTVAAGCSNDDGDGGAQRAARRATTTAPQVLAERIEPDAAPSGDAATRFTLPDGTTVLVPANAVPRGAKVDVTAVVPQSLGLGAVEAGTSAYEVSASAGTIAKPVAIQLTVPDAPDRSAAVAVAWDEATRSWRPVNADAGPGTLTIYAPRAGTYSWVRWNWQIAAAVGVETVRAVVGPTQPAGADLSCGSAAAIASLFRPRSAGDGSLRWCAGSEGLAVANDAAVPVSLRQRGLVNGAVARRDPLTGGLAELVRKYAPADDGVAFDVLAPGERASFGLTEGVEAAASTAADGPAQSFHALGAAAAFTAGLYAGTSSAAVAVLQRDTEVRNALLAALDAPGCADSLGVAERSPAAWAELAQRLVVRCVPDAVARQLVAASAKQSVLRAAFASTTAALPAASQPLLGPALVEALTPLIESADAASVTLVPVPPEPTTTTTVAAPVTPTPPPTAPPPTVVVGTTTVATAPPVGATTTVTAAATTTVAAGPPPVLSLPLGATCSDRGGNVSVAGVGFTPRGAVTLTYTAPNGSRRNVGGTASTIGTFVSSFDCRGQARGEWTVTARDEATNRTAAAVTFTVTRT